MSSLLLIVTLGVSIINPFSPFITIVTYYYVFESEQLADDHINSRLGAI